MQKLETVTGNTEGAIQLRCKGWCHDIEPDCRCKGWCHDVKPNYGDKLPQPKYFV